VSEPRRLRRPAEVTVIVVLTYVSALVDIVSGLLLILARYLPDLAGTPLRSFVTIGGAVVVLFGFLTIAVASGVARGDRHARLIMTVLLGLAVLVALAAILVDPGALWFQLVNILLSVVVIVVLWTGRARQFFVTPSA
jgi:holin-like protein